VRSIVDRFLEHSRIFYFENAGRPDYWIGSADWMSRNFFRRIEAVFPIEDPSLRRRIKTEILQLPLEDEVKAWTLKPDGTYRAPQPARGAIWSQVEFMKRARASRAQ
jgi:polyphosphate kinase